MENPLPINPPPDGRAGEVAVNGQDNF